MAARAFRCPNCGSVLGTIRPKRPNGSHIKCNTHADVRRGWLGGRYIECLKCGERMRIDSENRVEAL